MPEIKNALVPGTLLTSGQQTYRVVKTLGAGGFGITYLVEAQVVEGDNVHSFFYAMKEHFLGRCCERIEGSSKVVYSNPVADEVQNSQRDFVAEAVRLQKLGSRHDNIVKVREIFEANNTAYYIMEYLQGNSLRDYVKQRGPLSEQEMLSLTTPILDAIGFLHANRMTHLDIKPENIMLTPDPTGKPRPVLIDFGLSKHYDGEGRPTSTINTLGCSDGYSPVEQYGGITTFSPTADIYSLGATMAFCVTGQNPKKATDMLPGDAEALTAGLSPNVGGAICRMLNMNRAARPQNASEVFRMLQAPAPAPVAPQPAAAPMGGPSATTPLGTPAAAPGGPGMPPPPPYNPTRPVTPAMAPGAVPGAAPRPRPGQNGKSGSKKTLFTILGIVGGIAVLGGIGALLYNILGSDSDDEGFIADEYSDEFVVDENGELTSYGIGNVVDEYYTPRVQRGTDRGAQRKLAAEVGNAPVAIGLLWNTEDDLDLIINQPNASYIYFAETSDSSTGGSFGGDCRGGENSMEYVKWTRPSDGRYDIFVRGRNLPASGVPVKVVVKDGSEFHTYSARLEGHGEQDDYKIDFYFYEGQNQAAAEAPAPAPAPVRPDNSGSSNSSDGIPVTNANGSSDSYSSGNAVSSYIAANTTTAYDSQAVSRANSVGRSGPLKVTLMWDFSGDCDLIVNQADMTDIYYGNTSDSGYGAVFSGDQTGGNRSYESISWSEPGNGIYDVFVRTRSVPSSGGIVKVVVKDGSNTTTYTTRIRKSGSDMKDIRICQFTYSGSSSRNSGSSSSSSSAPVTNASGSSNSYSHGDMVSSYVSANTSTSYDSGAVSRASSISGSGPLKVTLMWDATNDLDLIVNQANATDIYYGNRTDSSYGAQHTGDNTGGSGSYESISWSRPGSGTYDVFVRVRGTVSGSGIPVKVVVKNGSNTTTYSTRITKNGSDMKDVRICQFSYSGGSSSSSSSSGSAPTTYANGSGSSYSSGNTVSSYIEANTSTAYDSQAVSRANNVGRNGSLKVTLMWDFSGDCDLIVNQANGTDIYYGNSSDSSYGARYSGDQTGGNNSYESISWSNPGNGIYDVFVRARSVPGSGGVVKVVVKNGSNTTTYTTRISKSSSDYKDIRICQFRY